MNLNHILLFLAVASPLLALARGWRPTAPYYGWRIAAIVILAITGVAWIMWPAVSGYIGGAAWFLLLFLPAVALRKITQLAAQGDYKTARRLATALQILHPTAELREQVGLFRHFESNAPHPSSFRQNRGGYDTDRPVRSSQLRSAPAVFLLILVNVLVFVFEIRVGNWDNPEVLHRIGALEPRAVIQGEYWRLLTAVFLHGGFLHLGFNLFALYVLGPPLEAAIGMGRFLACYLISGLGSSAGVVALNQAGLIRTTQVIGASGCIMGLVGAWAGVLLRDHHAPLAKQRLANIGVIVAIQIAFDLSTPEVSMSAHMCGLVSGFFLGLILAPRRAEKTRA